MTLLGTAACDWISLAVNALTYETLAAGEAGNVVATDSLAYVTLGDSGLAVVDARTGRRIALVPPPEGTGSVDDVSLSDGFLFVLDAREPGHLGVLSLRNPRNPSPVGAPRDVGVGPFSGVSAASGLAIVSGGTSRLSAWRYDATGALSGPIATSDFGRGQPDVLVTRGGLLLVSTHYEGPRFGVDVARVDMAATIALLGQLPLPGAGFTAGGAKPANFPMEAAQLGDSSFVLAFARGLARIVVRHDGVPRLDGVTDVGGTAVNVDVRGDTAAVAVTGDSAAVVLIDFSSGPRVSKRLALPPGTIPGGVALTSRSVIVAARGRGILALHR